MKLLTAKRYDALLADTAARARRDALLAAAAVASRIGDEHDVRWRDVSLSRMQRDRAHRDAVVARQVGEAILAKAGS